MDIRVCSSSEYAFTGSGGDIFIVPDAGHSLQLQMAPSSTLEVELGALIFTAVALHSIDFLLL